MRDRAEVARRTEGDRLTSDVVDASQGANGLKRGGSGDREVAGPGGRLSGGRLSGGRLSGCACCGAHEHSNHDAEDNDPPGPRRAACSRRLAVLHRPRR